MAIREVLTSNTFEQQRQTINSLGTDVGDLSSLNSTISGVSSVVGALNQLDTEMGDINALTGTFAGQTNLVSAVNLAATNDEAVALAIALG